MLELTESDRLKLRAGMNYDLHRVNRAQTLKTLRSREQELIAKWAYQQLALTKTERALEEVDRRINAITAQSVAGR